MAEQRASDADRERTADHLRRAGGDGRLEIDELDERVQLAYAARTRGELDRLLEDLTEDRAPAPRTTTGSGLTVRRGDGGSRWVISIMGGATRNGHWRVGRRCLVLNIMGGSDVDLNDAELADDVVEMTVFSLMGGGDVRVPEHLRLEVTDIAIMGGNSVSRPPAGGEDSGGPVVHLRLISIMGGTNVRRGRRLSRAERRRLDQQPGPDRLAP